MPAQSISHADERKIAVIIALYLAIYGGDPVHREGTLVADSVREAAALDAIASLSHGLDEKTQQAVLHAIAPVKHTPRFPPIDAETVEKRLSALGVSFVKEGAEKETAAPASSVATPYSQVRQRERIYCFRFRGDGICIQIPLPNPELSTHAS